MTEFTPVSATIGGAMIGLSAVLLLALIGRIAGISGIMNGALERGGDQPWRILFVIGLVLGGLLVQSLTGEALIPRNGFPVPVLIGAGLLVGFGTRLGSGCTSGHGVCGLARLSPRSVVATATFLGIGVATASAAHVLGSAL